MQRLLENNIPHTILTLLILSVASVIISQFDVPVCSFSSSETEKPVILVEESVPASMCDALTKENPVCSPADFILLKAEKNQLTEKPICLLADSFIPLIRSSKSDVFDGADPPDIFSFSGIHLRAPPVLG